MKLWQRLASVSPIRFGRSFLRCCPIVAVSLLAVTWGAIAGQPQAKTKGPKQPSSRSPAEPLASALSLTKAQQFLDGETLTWLGERKSLVATPATLTSSLAQAAATQRHTPHARSVASSRTASWRGTAGAKGLVT